MSDNRIALMLHAESRKSRGGKTPSARTVGRIRQEFWKLPAEEQQQYGLFCWPDSMDNGALPWEAASAAFELLQRAHQDERPPPVRLVRWFWRITLAAPDADFSLRLPFAQCMAAAEVLGGPVGAKVQRWVESYLRFAPWQSVDRSMRAAAGGLISEWPLAELREAGWTQEAVDLMIWFEDEDALDDETPEETRIIDALLAEAKKGDDDGKRTRKATGEKMGGGGRHRARRKREA